MTVDILARQLGIDNAVGFVHRHEDFVVLTGRNLFEGFCIEMVVMLIGQCHLNGGHLGHLVEHCLLTQIGSALGRGGERTLGRIARESILHNLYNLLPHLGEVNRFVVRVLPRTFGNGAQNAIV